MNMTTPTAYGAAELNAHEVYAGAILWLPPLADAGNGDRELWVIDFVPMTTFNRHPEGIASLWNVEDQKRYLSIEPAALHPVFNFRLQYKYGLVSNRGSNVCLKTIYKMQWRDAQKFYDGHGAASREPWALTEESMERLMEKFSEYTKGSANGAVYEAGKQYCFSKTEVKVLKRQVRRQEWMYCRELTRSFAWLWSMVLLRVAWPLLVVLLRAAYVQELAIAVYLLALLACSYLAGLERCLFWAFHWVRWARQYAFHGLTRAVRKGDEVLHYVNR
ncbi:hypothetical protein PRZ48_012195 [Zasmidium cellare]|uniref:Uncharacterized protein n=1 Tax=Zasmidium cellare TaxID=395010 RepID=A0ABR0E491_ZASCE|nr:hypothetical protein PRZ48_012195 [Zasmidium cellare]